MKPQTDNWTAQAFIGLINYYRDMWARWFNMIKLLIYLTSTRVKLNCILQNRKCFIQKNNCNKIYVTILT